MKIKQLIIAGISSVLMVASHAHELVIKPLVDSQGVITGVVDVYLTEVYLQPGRMPEKTSKVELLQQGERKSLDVTTDLAASRLQVKLPPVSKGKEQLVLASSQRIKNVKKTDKIEAKKIQQLYFAKALVKTSGDSATYSQSQTQQLEIVLLDNPANLNMGDELVVKILYKGEPVAAKILAARDGVSAKEHAYVIRSKSDAQGLATLSITEPGWWMLRSKLDLLNETPGFDKDEVSTSFVFFVPQ